MKNNSFTFAFLTVLVISLVIASTPTINPNTPITDTTTLNSKTNGQGDLVTLPESTNPVNLNGIITSAEWSDAYNVTLTIWNYTGPGVKDYSWEAEFLIKHNNTHILMAEKIDDPAVHASGAFMLIVGITIDMFMIYGQDIMGVAGNPVMGTILPLDFFQPPEQPPQPDEGLGGANNVIGNTSYSPSEGPSAEWARPLSTGDNYDLPLDVGLLFFVTVGYNDGYQPEDSPVVVDPEDTLMFTLGRLTVPYSTATVTFDGVFGSGEWTDALQIYPLPLSNTTKTWDEALWIQYNGTHLLFFMNVIDSLTAGNFTFLSLIENLLTFNKTDFSTDIFGLLGNNTNTYTETYDYYLSGPPEGSVPQSDTDLGGTNDTYGATYYDSEAGPTAEFCHPLNSSDPNDDALQPGSTFLGMVGYSDGWWHFGVDRPPALSPSGAFILEDINDPVIDSPSNVIYEEGSTGNNITWHPRDLNPEMFNVTQDPGSILLNYDTWAGGDITANVDGLSIGTYTFTCSVNDTFGNSASDSVIVEVVLDLQDPVIFGPSDITYEEGATGNSITWTSNDAYPDKYNITKDGSFVKSGLWNISGELITVLVDGLEVGEYTYTCTVNDTSGHSASDSVTVKVIEVDTTPPTINSPDDITYEEGETGYSITWIANDDNPNKYTITKNDTVVDSGDWESGEGITIDFNGLEVGIYTYVCTVNDTNGNSVSDEVTVTVTAPEEVSEFSYGYAFIALVALPLLALIAYRKTRKLRT